MRVQGQSSSEVELAEAGVVAHGGGGDAAVKGDGVGVRERRDGDFVGAIFAEGEAEVDVGAVVEEFDGDEDLEGGGSGGGCGPRAAEIAMPLNTIW